MMDKRAAGFRRAIFVVLEEVMSKGILLFLLGSAVAVAAHVGSKMAERRARDRYRELMGEHTDLPEDGWRTIRPLVGPWGCLLAAFEFLRGLGVVTALAAGLYLVVG